MPIVRAALCTSRTVTSGVGPVGLMSTASRVAPGTVRVETPNVSPPLRRQEIDAGQVATRPGEARDETKPDRVFGDEEDDGIVAVAALAAGATGTRQNVTIRSTCWRTSSAASAGSGLI